MPRRVQMTRQRPWRHEHPDAVIVARPSKWGNPWRGIRATGGFSVVYVSPTVPFDATVDDIFFAALSTWPSADAARAECVRLYRAWLIDIVPGTGHPADPWMQRDIREQLAGRDLCCWCPLGSPCHADVLLELANPGWTP